MDKKLFYEGEEVACIDELCVAVNPQQQGIPDVFYGKTYIIKEYDQFKHGVWWVSLIGFLEGCLYSEDSFAPLRSIKELIQIEELIEY